MLLLNVGYWLWVQPIDAAHELSLSVGVQLLRVTGLVVRRGVIASFPVEIFNAMAPVALIFYRDLNCTIFKQLRIGCCHAECSNSNRKLDSILTSECGALINAPIVHRSVRKIRIKAVKCYDLSFIRELFSCRACCMQVDQLSLHNLRFLLLICRQMFEKKQH